MTPELKFFMWKLIQGFIPTKVNLQKKVIHIEDRCVVCGKDKESVSHVIFLL